MDVDRMMSGKINHHDHHPVIRTITDHLDAVLCLCFHPTVSVLASGSCDNTVKFYDYSKPSVKKAYRSLMEVASVRCLTYHPCGQYMLIGTEQSTCKVIDNVCNFTFFSNCVCSLSVRLYDANTFQCFVSSDSRDQHSLAINSASYI
jgi:cleavage stimulation factor subunit 1